MSGSGSFLGKMGWLFAGIGLALIVTATGLAYRQQQILKAWERVDALVLKSRVASSTSLSNNQGVTVAMYAPELQFQYTVGGRSYVTPASSPVSNSNYAAVKHVADRYSPGTIHSILYNPNDPNDIRFDAGYNFDFFFMPIVFCGMGVIFVFVGFTLGAVARRSPPRRCPTCNAPVDSNAHYCSNCARAMNSTTRPEPGGGAR